MLCSRYVCNLSHGSAFALRTDPHINPPHPLVTAPPPPQLQPCGSHPSPMSALQTSSKSLREIMCCRPRSETSCRAAFFAAVVGSTSDLIDALRSAVANIVSPARSCRPARVRGRSPGPLPGYEETSRILIISKMIRMGKGFINLRLPLTGPVCSRTVFSLHSRLSLSNPSEVPSIKVPHPQNVIPRVPLA